MRIPVKKSALAAAVMAVALLGNGVVLADGGRYHYNRQDYGHQKQYKQRHHKANRYAGYHDRDYYYQGHHGRHVTNYYEYDDDDDGDEKLLIGIAIGGLLGYVINHAGYE
ncbi:MAG: hypothetical protein PVH54_09390 [Gammaproteobacteria bacterium]|jgi:hypothetical protein